AELAGDVIARARNLAGVTDEDPATREDAVHLVGEDARIRVEGHVDPIVLHERFVVDHRDRYRHDPGTLRAFAAFVDLAHDVTLFEPAAPRAPEPGGPPGIFA